MKYRMVLLIQAFCFSFALAASPADLFKQANQLYQQTAYKEALVTYDSIVRQGLPSATLYYNMGNCYYRTGNIPSALLYYERAQLLDPKNPDIKHNIMVANTKITDKFEKMPELFPIRWWKAFTALFSTDEWAFLSLIILGLSALSFILFRISCAYTLKKTSFLFGVFLLMAFMVCSLGALQQYRLLNKKTAIIFITKTNVTSSPDGAGNNKFTIHAGSKVEIIDEINDYQKIRIINGNTGWIPKGAAKDI